MVIQENRTPDNLFGAPLANGNFFVPGVNLVKSGLNSQAAGGSTTLIPTLMYTCYDLSHTYTAFVQTWDGGKMDGAGIGDPGNTPPCYPPAYAAYAYADNSSGTNPPHEVQPYFDIATQFGFANYMFQTNQGPSFPAHQFLFSGTSAPVTDGSGSQAWFASENPTVVVNGKVQQAGSPTGCLGDNTTSVTQVTNSGTFPFLESGSLTFAPWTPPISGAPPGFPCYQHNSIANVLDSAGVSWNYYTNDRTSLWTAPNALSQICPLSSVSGKLTDCPVHTADWNNVIQESAITTNAGEILGDIAACKLKNVTFVTPDGAWSDHSGGCGAAFPYCAALGPSWVANIVDAVGAATNCDDFPGGTQGYFQDTVVLITWDDWGGWYDHVSPETSVATLGYPNNTGQNNVYGFRVPLLVVSAYTASHPQGQGYVSGPIGSNPNVCYGPPYCHDFGSILNFIEYVFGSGGNSLLDISPGYHYADYFAPDGPHGKLCNSTLCPYSLADFFNFKQGPASFQTINVPVRYNLSSGYFQNYNQPPQAPDND